MDKKNPQIGDQQNSTHVAVQCDTEADVQNFTRTQTHHFTGTNIGVDVALVAVTEQPESVHHVDQSTDVSIPAYHGALTHDELDTLIVTPPHLVICTHEEQYVVVESEGDVAVNVVFERVSHAKLASIFTLSVSGDTASIAQVPHVQVHALTSACVAISTLPATVVLAFTTVPVARSDHDPPIYCCIVPVPELYIIIPLIGLVIAESLAVASAQFGRFTEREKSCN